MSMESLFKYYIVSRRLFMREEVIRERNKGWMMDEWM